MPPVSSIKRLPPELRAAIAEQLAAGRTLNEVAAHVRGMGADVSRSAIGRHKVQLDKILERSRRTREIAEVLAQSAGRGGDSLLIKGHVELLQGILMQAAEGTLSLENAASGESGEALSSKSAMQLAIAMEKLAKAARHGAELERMAAETALNVVDTEGGPPAKQIEIVFVEPAQVALASAEQSEIKDA